MCDCQKICLIIPCYNEEQRLDIEEFRRYCSDELIFVFVNDGSTDNTHQLLIAQTGRNWHVVNLDENRGKSEAIRQGVLFVQNSGLVQDIQWFGFWDSDLSVPLYELENFFRYSACFSTDAEAIIGSRVRRMGSEIIRSAVRHYLGRLFCTLVSFLFSMTYYDTQCGAKIFKRELLETGFVQPFSSNWIFDVELLLRLRTRTIIEYPLHVWQEKPGSRIRFSTVPFEVLKDLISLKKNNGRWGKKGKD